MLLQFTGKRCIAKHATAKWHSLIIRQSEKNGKISRNSNEGLADSSSSSRSQVLSLYSVADPGFAKGGDHGKRAEREPKRGSGGGAPSGVQGQSPWWGSGGERSPPEAESFLSIFIQKVAKS